MTKQNEQRPSDARDTLSNERLEAHHHLQYDQPERQFRASQDRLEEDDLRLLDRVWERLEAHVARQSTTLSQNRNLRADAGRQLIQERPSGPRRLELLAATIVLILLVGSLAIVLHSIHQGREHPTSGGSPIATLMPSQTPSSTSWNNAVTIVDPSKTGKAAHFSPNMLKLAPGVNLVLWTNATPTPQVVLSDTAAFPPLTVGLDQPQKLLFDKLGTFTFHLASHPAAHLTIMVTALPSQPG